MFAGRSGLAWWNELAARWAMPAANMIIVRCFPRRRRCLAALAYAENTHGRGIVGQVQVGGAGVSLASVSPSPPCEPRGSPDDSNGTIFKPPRRWLGEFWHAASGRLSFSAWATN